jgi:hypothetical protein
MVLVVIAEAAHNDGTHAWPSLSKIAALANIGTRSVDRALVELEAAGEVVIERRHRRTNRYTIPGLTSAPPTPIEQVRLPWPSASSATPSAPTVTHYGAPWMAHQPSSNLQRTVPRARMVSGGGTQAGDE